MARVQYGAIVTEIKGKVQGHVFQGGNVGFVLRNKGYTKGISSVSRFTSSKNLAVVTSAWKSLSDAQRAVWQALTSTWLFTNKFGASYQGSGFQVFTAYNLPHVILEDDVQVAPVAPVVPANPGLLSFSTGTTAALAFNIPNLTLSNDTIWLYASPPVSVGVNGNNIRMAYLDAFDYSVAGPYTFRTKYIAKYGTYPAGSKIFIRTECRNFDYPYMYYRQFANHIIT